MRGLKPILIIAILVQTCSLWSQAFIDLNLALPAGACEIDWDRNGIVDGTSVSTSWDSGWRAALGAEALLDASRKFGGGFSQHIRFNRASGEEGSLTLIFPLISNNLAVNLSAGQPVLVRARYFAEGFQNADYEISMRSGDTYPVLLPRTSADSGGWQTVSTIAVLQADSVGQLILNLYLRIRAGAGAAAGRVWIDEVECILPQYPTHPERTPTPIQFSVFNFTPSHWTDYLSAPLPSITVQGTQYGFPLKRLFGSRIQHYLYIHSVNYPVQAPPQNCRLLYGCEHFLNTNPDWVLRDQNGNPIIYERYNSYYLDIGLPQVQQRAIEGFTTLGNALPSIDGFFLDGFADWPGAVIPSGSGLTCPRYPTYDSIFPAWDGWVRTVLPVVRQTLNKKVLVNLGARPGLLLNGQRPVSQWLSYIDGILLEGPIVGVNYSQQTYTPRVYAGSTTSYYAGSWRNTLRCVQEYPNTNWHLILYWDQREQSRALLRYSLATYWLIYRPNIYLCLEDRLDSSYTHLKTLAQPEVWIPLGEPVAPYEIIQGNWNNGGLFQRRFQYGLVLVNPTDSTTYTFTTSQAYKNWDGQVLPANTTLQIPPKTGVALYAAPEVRVSITAQPETALPGELVTIVVECRNAGLVDARDVQVEAPIPQGLSVVSVSNGGVMSNGAVQWTIPALAPGGSRQFQIQARVE
ncbi:MAG: DUF11 domain-containing protein [Fimbriimonadales bacterium]|nr:MAG: hypothetical protein KatS3mg018_2498 [Fimbriimonadales bacterium]